MTLGGNSTTETAPVASKATDEAHPVAAAEEDIELLRRIEGGDEAAFRTLTERHGRYLYGVAHALVGNHSDAEDVVQETFIAVLNGGFRAESSVRTWLVRILIKRAGMLRRSWFRKGRRTEPLEANPHVASHSAASETAGAEAKLDLTTMLQSLSSEHRAVIVLRELEQMSYAEMAAALGVPRGTVESRLHRAREELRRKFKGYL
jgi:RNA polymerase sigma-70 factor (ECF subfamily)